MERGTAMEQHNVAEVHIFLIFLKKTRAMLWFI
jgi:hypothetical protein